MTKKIFQQLIIGLLVMTLSSCSALTRWTRLKGQEIKDGKRDFSAVVPADWMRYNWGKAFYMTKDGIVLNNISVAKIKFNKELAYTKKKYSEDMNVVDVAEMEIDNIRSNPQVKQFHVLSNTPTSLDNHSAYRLDYQYTSAGGLKTKGIQYGFVHSTGVYRIRYEAALQHYFPASLKDFERFVESFKVL